MTARFQVRPEPGRSHLHRRQRQPTVIRNLFKEKHVQYSV